MLGLSWDEVLCGRDPGNLGDPGRDAHLGRDSTPFPQCVRVELQSIHSVASVYNGHCSSEHYSLASFARGTPW